MRLPVPILAVTNNDIIARESSLLNNVIAIKVILYYLFIY